MNMFLVVLGSMSSPFDNGNVKKMSIANEATVKLLDHLDDYDRFGLVLFNREGRLKQSMAFLKDIDIDKLKMNILGITANGGTYMQDGYKMAVKQYEHVELDDEYDNRVIFITDAIPNTGYSKSDDLYSMIKDCAEREENRIYTSVIGVGIDFNTDLVDKIMKVRGANYFAVKSRDEFIQRLDDEFDYMVTPMIFNLKLDIKAEGDGCYIYKVYGDGFDQDDGDGDDNKSSIDDTYEAFNVMNVTTLFPTKKNDGGESKGGVILLQIKKKDVMNGNKNLNMKIEISYEDQKGKKFNIVEDVMIKDKSADDIIEDGDYFDNVGIRKAVLLTRYVLLMKEWIKFTNNPWKLRVDDEYKRRFKEFCKYFEKEMKEIGDDALEQELKILQKLSDLK